MDLGKMLFDLFLPGLVLWWNYNPELLEAVFLANQYAIIDSFVFIEGVLKIYIDEEEVFHCPLVKLSIIHLQFVVVACLCRCLPGAGDCYDLNCPMVPWNRIHKCLSMKMMSLHAVNQYEAPTARQMAILSRAILRVMLYFLHHSSETYFLSDIFQLCWQSFCLPKAT